MFNPLIQDLSQLKIEEIESKITELSKIYFIAAKSGNSGLIQQILVTLDSFKSELKNRHLSTKYIGTKDGEKEFDDLIKIN